MRRVGDVMAGMGDPQERGAPDPYAGGVMTKHGWFPFDEEPGAGCGSILAAGGRLGTDPNGNPVVRFPTWTREQGRHFRVIPAHKLTEGE